MNLEKTSIVSAGLVAQPEKLISKMVFLRIPPKPGIIIIFKEKKKLAHIDKVCKQTLPNLKAEQKTAA